MISHENEISEGTRLMLLRFAHPQGESGNPLIGDVVKALEESGGISPINAVVEITHIPPEQILRIGNQLRGVFEISEGNISCPSLQQEVERAT